MNCNRNAYKNQRHFLEPISQNGRCNSGKAAQHDADHGDFDDGFARFRSEFAVSAQSAVVHQPAEGPLHHPTTRQSHKTLLIVAPPHDLKNQHIPIINIINQFPGITAARPDQSQSSLMVPSGGSISFLGLMRKVFPRTATGQDVKYGVEYLSHVGFS